MRKVLKKGMALVLAAAMVVAAAPADKAGAAKKPAFAKKSNTVTVKKSITVKIKNAGKKKTVKLSLDKKGKAAAKLAKSKVKSDKKGNASVKVTGKKEGKGTLTGKIGKKSFKTTIVVKAATNATTPTAPAGASASASTGSAAPSTAPSTAPTATPVPTPTKTPTPTPTAPMPKVEKYAGELKAVKASALDAKNLKIDGVEDEDEWYNAGSVYTFDLTDKAYAACIRGGASFTKITAKFMWNDGKFYALITSDKDMSAADTYVIIDKDTDTKGKGNAVKGVAKLSEDKKLAEIEVDLAGVSEEVFAVDKEVGFELQVGESADKTFNLFDVDDTYKFIADGNKWEKDTPNKVVAGTDADAADARLGKIMLAPAQQQATDAYFTDKGADIRTAAAIPADKWEFDPAEGETEPAFKTKKMTFVDPKFWTDVYGDKAPIVYTHVNCGENIYMTDPENVKLCEKLDDGTFASDARFAKSYIIWDADYLYVLFDVNDDDISPTNDDHYTTDSTEFFLDEDYSQPADYASGNGDEVQLRVDADGNIFSSNDAGTAKFELVAHAVGYKEGNEIKTEKSDKTTGYMVEYIIKLQKSHKAGETMGMDLQINDCYTVPAGEATEDNPNPVATASRAATLTAYDTTNNCYQYPNCFGRVKLVKPEAPATPAE